jgi:hypothetical protein
MVNRSRPQIDDETSAPHGLEREKRQPYAAEHEDYRDGVALPPQEGQGGQTPPDAKKTGARKR